MSRVILRKLAEWTERTLGRRVTRQMSESLSALQITTTEQTAPSHLNAEWSVDVDPLLRDRHADGSSAIERVRSSQLARTEGR
jgi:hypothetical protein